MEKILRRVAREDVLLSVLSTSSLDRIRAERGQIEQVVMNLVVNARDAMPAGGKIMIETANVLLDEAYARETPGAKAGPHVMVSVTDTGSGMDRTTRTRIFEPFFTTKETGKGSGLGLATVLGIVRRYRGSIWVYSELGRGSTFKIFLPELRRRCGRDDAILDPSPRPVHAAPAASALARRLGEERGRRVRRLSRVSARGLVAARAAFAARGTGPRIRAGARAPRARSVRPIHRHARRGRGRGCNPTPRP